MLKIDNEQWFDDEIVFADSEEIPLNINKILYSNDENYIKSIQCFYRLKNDKILEGNKYGNVISNEKTIKINKDEKIIKIESNYKKKKGIHFIKLKTNKNKEYIIGNIKKTENTQQEFNINKNQNIKWISGGYFNKNITYLAFHLNTFNN